MFLKNPMPPETKPTSHSESIPLDDLTSIVDRVGLSPDDATVVKRNLVRYYREGTYLRSFTPAGLEELENGLRALPDQKETNWRTLSEVIASGDFVNADEVRKEISSRLLWYGDNRSGELERDALRLLRKPKTDKPEDRQQKAAGAVRQAPAKTSDRSVDARRPAMPEPPARAARPKIRRALPTTSLESEYREAPPGAQDAIHAKQLISHELVRQRARNGRPTRRVALSAMLKSVDASQAWTDGLRRMESRDDKTSAGPDVLPDMTAVSPEDRIAEHLSRKPGTGPPGRPTLTEAREQVAQQVRKLLEKLPAHRASRLRIMSRRPEIVDEESGTTRELAISEALAFERVSMPRVVEDAPTQARADLVMAENELGRLERVDTDEFALVLHETEPARPWRQEPRQADDDGSRPLRLGVPSPPPSDTMEHIRLEGTDGPRLVADIPALAGDNASDIDFDTRDNELVPAARVEPCLTLRAGSDRPDTCPVPEGDAVDGRFGLLADPRSDNHPDHRERLAAALGRMSPSPDRPIPHERDVPREGEVTPSAPLPGRARLTGRHATDEGRPPEPAPLALARKHVETAVSSSV